jgi:orotate phosphoribosyltransferase
LPDLLKDNKISQRRKAVGRPLSRTRLCLPRPASALPAGQPDCVWNSIAKPKLSHRQVPTLRSRHPLIESLGTNASAAVRSQGMRTFDRSVGRSWCDDGRVHRRELAADIEAVCRLSGVFTLRSGLTSEEYFDKYLFESDPKLLKRVAEAMVSLIPRGTDLVGGLELGGVPLATVVSQLSGLPALFVRKQAKDYGTERLAEGVIDITGRRVTLIEDVITTGGAVRQAALSLRAQGAEVSSVV